MNAFIEKKQDTINSSPNKRYVPPSLRKTVNSSENKNIDENNKNNR